MGNYYLNDAIELAREMLKAIHSGQTENGQPIKLDEPATIFLDMRLDQLIDSLTEASK
jgi:hypothetical protein